MRLIDADALIHTLCSHCVEFERCDTRYTGCDDFDIKAVTVAPTIDPVKHSRWFEGHCVRCFFDFGYGANTSEFRYCPNCGAKMDGEVQE